MTRSAGPGTTATANLSAVILGANSSIGGTGNMTIHPGITGAFSLTKVGAGTVTPPAAKGGQKDYLLYPSAEEILTELLPSYVRNAVYRALVETVAAEQSARRTAMKNATDNAGEMLQLLRRTYNRARQAQITQEIAEIVGGASALQG